MNSDHLPIFTEATKTLECLPETIQSPAGPKGVVDILKAIAGNGYSGNILANPFPLSGGDNAVGCQVGQQTNVKFGRLFRGIIPNSDKIIPVESRFPSPMKMNDYPIFVPDSCIFDQKVYGCLRIFEFKMTVRAGGHITIAALKIASDGHKEGRLEWEIGFVRGVGIS
jgi:hypothetical protein